jgi:hypothetical protein
MHIVLYCIVCCVAKCIVHSALQCDEVAVAGEGGGYGGGIGGAGSAGPGGATTNQLSLAAVCGAGGPAIYFRIIRIYSQFYQYPFCNWGIMSLDPNDLTDLSAKESGIAPDATVQSAWRQRGKMRALKLKIYAAGSFTTKGPDQMRETEHKPVQKQEPESKHVEETASKQEEETESKQEEEPESKQEEEQEELEIEHDTHRSSSSIDTCSSKSSNSISSPEITAVESFIATEPASSKREERDGPRSMVDILISDLGIGDHEMDPLASEEEGQSSDEDEEGLPRPGGNAWVELERKVHDNEMHVRLAENIVKSATENSQAQVQKLRKKTENGLDLVYDEVRSLRSDVHPTKEVWLRRIASVAIFFTLFSLVILSAMIGLLDAKFGVGAGDTFWLWTSADKYTSVQDTLYVYDTGEVKIHGNPTSNGVGAATLTLSSHTSTTGRRLLVDGGGEWQSYEYEQPSSSRHLRSGGSEATSRRLVGGSVDRSSSSSSAGDTASQSLVFGNQDAAGSFTRMAVVVADMDGTLSFNASHDLSLNPSSDGGRVLLASEAGSTVQLGLPTSSASAWTVREAEFAAGNANSEVSSATGTKIFVGGSAVVEGGLYLQSASNSSNGNNSSSGGGGNSSNASSMALLQVGPTGELLVSPALSTGALRVGGEGWSGGATGGGVSIDGALEGGTISVPVLKVVDRLDLTGAALSLSMKETSQLLQNMTLDSLSVSNVHFDQLLATTDVDIGDVAFRAGNLYADTQTSGTVAYYGSEGKLSGAATMAFDDSSGTLTVAKMGGFTADGAIDLHSELLTNANIASGTIDGVVIGASVPGAGTFSTLSSGGDIVAVGDIITAGQIIASDVVRATNIGDSTSSTTGALTVTGGLGVAKAANVGTSLTIGTNLAVAGSASITGAVSITGNTAITGTITNTATAASTTSTTGALTMAGGLGVQLDVNIGGGLSIAGTVSIIGNTAMAGTATITGNAAITGTITNTATAASTTSTTGAIVTSGGLGVALHANVGGDLGVGGNTAITGTVDITGAVSVTGVVSMTDDADASSSTTGTLTLSGGLGVAKAVFIGTDLEVGNALSVLGSLTAGEFSISKTTEALSSSTGALQTLGGLGVGKSVYVGAACTVTTNLDVGGAVTVTGAVGMASGLQVGGTAAVTGSLTTEGALSTTKTTEATSASTGALLSSGGLGVAKNTHIGGTLTVASTSTFNAAASFNSLEVESGPALSGSGISKVTNLASETDVDIRLVPGGTGKVEINSAATLLVGSLEVSATTITTQSNNQDITLQPQGTGKIVAANSLQLQPTGYVACAEATRGMFFYSVTSSDTDELAICMKKTDGTGYQYVQVAVSP